MGFEAFLFSLKDKLLLIVWFCRFFLTKLYFIRGSIFFKTSIQPYIGLQEFVADDFDRAHLLNLNIYDFGDEVAAFLHEKKTL